MAKMNDFLYSVVIRLVGSMLRRLNDVCVISDLRGVHIIFGNLFVTALLS